MRGEGLSDFETISQALGILNEVWRTNGVAQIKSLYINSELPEVEYYYHIQTPQRLEKRFEDEFVPRKLDKRNPDKGTSPGRDEAQGLVE
jgi:hypothetical protein